MIMFLLFNAFNTSRVPEFLYQLWRALLGELFHHKMEWKVKNRDNTERVNKTTLYICTETQMGFKRFLHSHASLKEIIIASFGELLDEKFHFGPWNHRSNTVFIFTMFYFYFKVNQRIYVINWVIWTQNRLK